MKKRISFWRVVALILLLSLLPVQSASADFGPKSTIVFDFIFQTGPVEVKNLKMFACEDAQCQIAKPTGVFSCQGAQNSCWSYAMPDDVPYYKIEVEFSDKLRTSNVFTRTRPSATYSVTVGADDLQVKELFKIWLDFNSPAAYLFIFIFILALLITLGIETVVARFFVKHWGVQIHWIKLANFISLPILWFLFPMLPLPLTWVWVVGEIFVVLFETAFLFFTNRESGLSLQQFGKLSLVMNLFSMVAGVLSDTWVLIGIILLIIYVRSSVVGSIIGGLVILAGLFFFLAYLPAKLMGNSNQR